MIFQKFQRRNKHKSEQGYLLVEILVLLGLFGIMGLALTQTGVAAQRARGKSVLNTLAMQIATESLENLITVQPQNLTSGHQLNDVVTRNGHRFNRVVSYTLDADNTATITVSVTQANALIAAGTSVSAKFPAWNSN